MLAWHEQHRRGFERPGIFPSHRRRFPSHVLHEQARTIRRHRRLPSSPKVSSRHWRQRRWRRSCRGGKPWKQRRRWCPGTEVLEQPASVWSGQGWGGVSSASSSSCHGLIRENINCKCKLMNSFSRSLLIKLETTFE